MPPSLNYLAASSNATAGRKRSIADIDDQDDHLSHESSKPKSEPVYGPGMTLTYPAEPSFHISAESQTGTWAEDKHDKEESVKTSAARPIAVSRKSQRLNTTTTPSGLSTSPESATVTPSTTIVDEHGNTMDALITALGIGWKPIQPEQARAYARYIENHYDLKQTEVMLESEGRSAYLVRATYTGVQQFLLFDESLAWCQPAGSTLAEVVQNIVYRPYPWNDLPRMSAQSRSVTPPYVTGSMEPAAASAPSTDMAMGDAMQI